MDGREDRGREDSGREDGGREEGEESTCHMAEEEDSTTERMLSFLFTSPRRSSVSSVKFSWKP